MASHGGGECIREQPAGEGGQNMPGIVCYARDGDCIHRKNAALFGPGDLDCSRWNVSALAELGEEQRTPQYGYWKRPGQAAMEDGGANLP